MYFQYANKTHDELYKIALNIVLEKTSCFFNGTSRFSWGTPLRPVFGFIIITLVEKKDIFKMSKNNSMEVQSRQKHQDPEIC